MRNMRRRPAASGIWSPSLYFQLVRGRTGDELRVNPGDAVYRWTLPWGLPAELDATGIAVEGTMAAIGSLMSADGVVAEGFCYIEPFRRGALGHFLLGYLEGQLTLALGDTGARPTIELRRITAQSGPGAEWRMRRVAARERVA